jgi:hypothetical protein
MIIRKILERVDIIAQSTEEAQLIINFEMNFLYNPQKMNNI